MRSYDSLVELARIYARKSHLTTSKRAAVELWQLARRYQEEAAKLDSDNPPEIGEPPALATLD